MKTISFPSISTGAYRCPPEKAAKTALRAVIDFIKKKTPLSR
ncbi:MAG: macro domain-containing protein [Persephonella sp.]|nr:macro domain-containing protein [Persephonella sp.]